MKNKMLLALITLMLVLLFLLASCASKHSYMRGSVVMKVDDTHANICMGINELKLNDTVTFENHKCTRVVGGAQEAEVNCRKTILGIGKVTRLLNNHYSQITTVGNFKFKEGTLVVKGNK